MAAIYNIRKQVLIRLSILCSLIFFACLLLFSCRHHSPDSISINWKDNKATEMVIPRALLQNKPPGSLQIRVENAHLPMLGNYELDENLVIFRPLISFTRGLNYSVFAGDKEIGNIRIPQDEAARTPSLISVYPTKDTLPENLLKIYLCFSKPMREGQSLKYILLLDKSNDTLDRPFLDLQPELWNEQRTVLTMWLDPGRIKRDLIPNLLKGNPLKEGAQYTLEVSAEWNDQEGLPLAKPYTRKFTVGSRDSTSPDIENWRLFLPLKNTREPLKILTGEALDYFLLLETISIKDEGGNTIRGKASISNIEQTWQFVPDANWSPGRYSLRVASQLEDLAGNNLNRPFDRDTRTKKTRGDKAFYERPFEISSSGTK